MQKEKKQQMSEQKNITELEKKIYKLEFIVERLIREQKKSLNNTAKLRKEAKRLETRLSRVEKAPTNRQ